MNQENKLLTTQDKLKQIDLLNNGIKHDYNSWENFFNNHFDEEIFKDLVDALHSAMFNIIQIRDTLYEHD